MILLLLGLLAERQLGTLRTALVFFGGQFAAVTLFLLVTQLARYAGDGWLGLMVGCRADRPVRRPSWRSAGGQQARLQARSGGAGCGPHCAVALLLVLYIGHAETVLALAGALAGLLRLVGGGHGRRQPPPLHRP